MKQKTVAIILPLVFIGAGIFGAFTMFGSQFDEKVMFKGKFNIALLNDLYPDRYWNENSDSTKSEFWNYKYQGWFQEKGYYGYETIGYPMIGGILMAVFLFGVMYHENIYRHPRPKGNKKVQ